MSCSPEADGELSSSTSVSECGCSLSEKKRAEAPSDSDSISDCEVARDIAAIAVVVVMWQHEGEESRLGTEGWFKYYALLRGDVARIGNGNLRSLILVDQNTTLSQPLILT